MSGELRDTLKKRLDENYAAFIESLQGKTIPELIAMAPEITAAQQLHEELLDVCDEDDAAFLLRSDNPLETVLGSWESELTGYDHSDEMRYMLWQVRGDTRSVSNNRDKTPFMKDDIAIVPDLDFSGREIIAYIEIGFDLGRRFQVYPNAGDVCDFYARYDPVSQTLRAELCIEDGNDGSQWWESVELLPSEQKIIVSLMEEICQKDMGKSLRDTWADRHPAIDRTNLHQKKNGRCQHER